MTIYLVVLLGSADSSKPTNWSKEGYFPLSGELVGTCWPNLRRFQGEDSVLIVIFLVFTKSNFRDDVTTLLTKAGSNLTVKALLDNLAVTTEFEQSMSKKWATSVRY